CLISLVTAVIEPVARLRTERSEVMTIYTISGGCFAPSDENLNHRKLFGQPLPVLPLHQNNHKECFFSSRTS
ncbi:MAG: hypothetical protein K6E78_05945, partial [Treponema sp.]|nr:hypothetical protein [Treponema sp.]